jgi:hypothetical protein
MAAAVSNIRMQANVASIERESVEMTRGGRWAARRRHEILVVLSA